MSGSSFKFVGIVLALNMFLANSLAEQSRLGVTVEDHSNPQGALVTQVLSGYPATKMRREGENAQSFFLQANNHVILEVNGIPVHDAQGCIEQVMASSQTVLLKVYNIQRGSTNEYSATLNGGGRSVAPNAESSVSDWVPGAKHPSVAHLVAGSRRDEWLLAPGYKRTHHRNKTQVRWAPRTQHASHPHVIAGLREGRWVPEPGYEWSDIENWQVVRTQNDWDNDGFGSSSPAFPWVGSEFDVSNDDLDMRELGNYFWRQGIRDEINRPYLPR